MSNGGSDIPHWVKNPGQIFNYNPNNPYSAYGVPCPGDTDSNKPQCGSFPKGVHYGPNISAGDSAGANANASAGASSKPTPVSWQSISESTPGTSSSQAANQYWKTTPGYSQLPTTSYSDRPTREAPAGWISTIEPANQQSETSATYQYGLQTVYPNSASQAPAQYWRTTPGYSQLPTTSYSDRPTREAPAGWIPTLQPAEDERSRAYQLALQNMYPNSNNGGR